MSDQLIERIATRNSCARLSEPAPSQAELESVFACAFRAPDHMRLKPWRYLTIAGSARAALGELFVSAALAKGEPLEPAHENKLRAMPLRAPLLIVAISNNLEHPKVPVWEQQVSCGVGLGYMLLALQALGYNGMWRTGEMAENSKVKAGLGLAEHESLIGFLYVGTPTGGCKAVPELTMSDYVKSWNG